MMKRFLLCLMVLVSLAGMAECAGETGGKPDNKGEVVRLLRSGELLYGRQLYTSAMKNYLEALRMAEQGRYNELTARAYNSIGNLYSAQGDYQMGLYFYRKALAMSRKTRGVGLQNAVLNNLVGTLCFVGQPDSGLVYLRQMEANVEHSDAYRYNVLMGRGLVAKGKGNAKASASYYIQARQYAIASGMDSSFVDNTNSCLAQLYLDTDRPDSAIVLLKKNEEWARHTHCDEFLAETMRLLTLAYDAKGDAARASACRMKYAELMEKLHASDELNAMKNTQFIYDANKNANTISLLTQQQLFDSEQIRTQARWLITLTVGLAVIIVLFVVVYIQKRQLRSAYNRLYDRSQLFLSAPMQTEENVPPAPQEGEVAVQDARQESAPRSLILSVEQRNQLLADISRVMESADEFCQFDFSIERLAKLVGSNARYVSEAINEGYGKNFRAFLNEYRVKEAMHRLADTEHYGSYTIKAIAESVGYKSQANFITVFTKLAGMKPSMYQKISKERISIDK